jgi:hypothetical protein
VLVGSSRHNVATKQVLEELFSSELNFSFRQSESDIEDVGILTRVKVDGNLGRDITLSPTPGNPDDRQQELTDYGLIVKAKHPYAVDRYVFVFAGCKAAAQCAIEHYFLSPTVLKKLLSLQREPLEILIEVQYRWGDSEPQLSRINGNYSIKALWPPELAGDNCIEIPIQD